MEPYCDEQYVLIISIKLGEKISHHLRAGLPRIRQVDIIVGYSTIWFILRIDRVSQRVRGIIGSLFALAVGARI